MHLKLSRQIAVCQDIMIMAVNIKYFLQYNILPPFSSQGAYCFPVVIGWRALKEAGGK